MHKSDDDEYSQDIDPLTGVNNPFVDPFMQADPDNCRFRDYSNPTTVKGFVLDFSDLETLQDLELTEEERNYLRET